MQANPVIVKELRGRMRGWRAAISLTFYLLVLSVILLLSYLVGRATIGLGSPQSAQVGKTLFSVLVIFQTIMVSLLTPAFTSGAITSEREHKTYDLLMTTLLPARSVIFGKLGSALAYVLLLLLALVPLESLTFMFGGVSPEEIILSQVTMFMAAVLFASIGIFWSSAVRTSVGSNVLTYGTILFVLIGIPLLYWAITTIAILPSYTYGNGSAASPYQQPWFIYMSGIILSSQPLVAMGLSEAFLSQGQGIEGNPLFIFTNSETINGQHLLMVSPWLVFSIQALIVSAILVAISIRLVRPIRYTRAQALAPVNVRANVSNNELEADQNSVVEDLPEGAAMAPMNERQAPTPGGSLPGPGG